jgi:Kef-type K+ transport system membrane component KefB
MIGNQGSTIIEVLISLVLLLFVANLIAELFHKFGTPIVLGELLAGIIVRARVS